jgi:HAMP domain-containing protein
VLFGRLRIQGKLALLVIIPLLGVVALAVPILLNRINAARDAQGLEDLVRLSTEVGSAVQEMNDERLLSVGFIFGQVSGDELVQKSARVRDRLARLSQHEDAPAALYRAVNSGARLNATRAQVLARGIAPNQVVANFVQISTPLIDSLGLVRRADLNTQVGRSLFALDRAMRNDDLINQASCYLTPAAIGGIPQFIGLFAQVLLQLQNNILNDQQFFTPDQYKLYLTAQDAFSARVGNEFLIRAPQDPVGAVALLDKTTLFPQLRSVNVLGGFVQKRVAADVIAAVSANRDSALRTALIVGLAALALLVVVFVLSIGMSRAVARPLQRLTRSADRIARAAETELERVADDEAEVARSIRMDPVDVQAKDEIGDLARAFDRVQTTAVRLVERQVIGRRNVAQMFGHVGRRTQNLVGRQLALIDDLERREADSDRLRELYRLDHMSSRLRRNASSLVVLSGAAGANEHMAPLPLNDVVRLALGEIEDYTRVDVDVPEEIIVVPALVGDLTLLLAELMENATSFSPPHTRVSVTAAELRGGARLAIVDHGLGLSPERLAEENARLTRRERLDLAPSEVLGLFVVGRLARRHGVEVTLTDTPDGGVTAWIDLRPMHLLARAESLTIGGPIQATVGAAPGEFGSLLSGGAGRSVPGSAQPFDAHVLDRATKTLQSARSWDAFAPARPGTPEIAAVPYQEAEIVDDMPRRPYDMGTPVAGRHPEAMVVLPATVEPIQIPRPRTPADDARQPKRGVNEPPHPTGLRRRVPGTQLPTESGPKMPAAPPSTDDALAAREAFEAFEAGVNRAQWDAIEAEMTSPTASGERPLARRVPGASLPGPERMPDNPPAGPSRPLDPDAARALVEQFEYGVALALNETKSRPEGQSR